MNSFANSLLVIVGVIAVAFLAIIAGTFMGALVGAIVGLFFSNAILSTFAAFGVTGVSMWQLGATLGFVGGFFKSVNSNGAKA